MNKIINTLASNIHNAMESALLAISPTKQRLNQADGKLKLLKLNLIHQLKDLVQKSDNLNGKKISYSDQISKIDSKIKNVNKEIKSLDDKMVKLGFIDHKLNGLNDYCTEMKDTFNKLQKKYESFPHSKRKEDELHLLKGYAGQVEKELKKLNEIFIKSSNKDEVTKEKIEKLEITLKGLDSLITKGSLQIQLEILQRVSTTPLIREEIQEVQRKLTELGVTVQESEMAFTREEVLEGAKKEIMTRFGASKEAAEDVCKRLISSHHLTKVKGAEFAKAMREAVSGIEAFGSVPQVYADEPEHKQGEDAKNFAKFLFTDIGIGRKMVSLSLVKALLVERNRPVLNEIAREFENIGTKLVEEMNKKNPPTPHEQRLT